MSFQEHSLQFTVAASNGDSHLSINGIPVGDVRRFGIVLDHRMQTQLQVEVYKRDAQGDLVPRLGPDGEPIRQQILLLDEQGQPLLDADGVPQRIVGDIQYEVVVLHGVMLADAPAFEVSGILPLSASNLEMAEALAARAVSA